MTEDKWLTGTDIDPMVHFFTARASYRKRLLFSCACCRRIWDLLVEESSRNAIEVAERLEEGKLWPSRFSGAMEAARLAASGLEARVLESRKDRFRASAHLTATWAAAMIPVPLQTAKLASTAVKRWAKVIGAPARPFAKKERAKQLALLRCILGNPFQSVEIDPVWLTWRESTIAKLVQAVYEERVLPGGELDDARLAILSDALEEAGCTQGALLEHLRSPGPHVRGCWAVDLLLARANPEIWRH